MNKHTIDLSLLNFPIAVYSWRLGQNSLQNEQVLTTDAAKTQLLQY